MELNSRECSCGLLRELSELPSSPVAFDENFKEYRLCFKDGSMEQLMLFCFWCGGKLPVSERSSFFEVVSEREKADIQNILSDVSSVPDVFRVLGKPDEEIRNSSSRLVFLYNSRWKTCDLHVLQDEFGAFYCAIVPKRKAKITENR